MCSKHEFSIILLYSIKYINNIIINRIRDSTMRKSKHVVDYMLRNHVTGFGHPSVGHSLPQSEIRLSFRFTISALAKHTRTRILSHAVEESEAQLFSITSEPMTSIIITTRSKGP